MLFTAPEFLFAFLPIVLAGFYMLGRHAGLNAAMLFLLAASLFFYGWWKPAYLTLLLLSIGANYFLGHMLLRPEIHVRRRKHILILGVTANLALLCVYKYLGLFADLVGASFEGFILPLAISFFTFQQISFLVDAFRKEAHPVPFRHYALFVTFFPHLIAGPLVHHKTMTPQFAKPQLIAFDWMRIASGSALFCMGLFKKGLIADNIAPFADSVFHTGGRVGFVDAWAGALAYTLQIYYDFSGYSDMAIGLAIMFGIALPLNFLSPYKATSIIDFWRRWHITLSHFLRDYLYIPLGGNRKGPRRRWVNLGITMLLGGLWHGANMTFVVWGALHGIYLGINHAWRGRVKNSLPRFLSWSLTFFSVMVAWVFFRADSVQSALRMLKCMFLLRDYETSLISPIAIVILLSVLACTLLWPNTAQIMQINRAGAGPDRTHGKHITWRPSWGWAIACGALAAFGLGGAMQQHAFLYFNF